MTRYLHAQKSTIMVKSEFFIKYSNMIAFSVSGLAFKNEPPRFVDIIKGLIMQLDGFGVPQEYYLWVFVIPCATMHRE